MGLGPGTNNHTQLISLRHLLYFAIMKSCWNLQIFGDSKTVIDWFNNTTVCHAYSLKHILEEIVFFQNFLWPDICFSHLQGKKWNCWPTIERSDASSSRGVDDRWIFFSRTYRYFHRPYIDGHSSEAAASIIINFWMTNFLIMLCIYSVFMLVNRKFFYVRAILLSLLWWSMHQYYTPYGFYLLHLDTWQWTCATI